MTYGFFELHVLRTARLTPSAVRIVFGGPDLSGFVSGGRDQRFKLFLPQAGQELPVVPSVGADWYAAWRAADPATRGIMRTYTVREQRVGEFDVDFALHGPAGPAASWARTAVPGDRLLALCPTVPDNGGVDFQPPPDTDWVLLTGDDTAIPAIEAILTWLDPAVPVRAWIEVHDPAGVRPLPPAPGREVTWLFGGGTLDAVRAAALPSGVPYAWVAGEAGVVRSVRRHLVREREVDRSRVVFTGYWRRGATEDDLLAESLP
ncbi:siderophore-interacting protein [Dactylosporangium sucinum]|uniref:Siderophore-interacting protein n=1 Tax=Dactylosporangium sucinum TaxID=1424081 RepID=A0A917U350_9ACTN|nr:siderophore-interacting protein [Dactylosporangium sucinum]GGM54178.1 siderophore-interacting protein [Dactylosporangium sucinum]